MYTAQQIMHFKGQILRVSPHNVMHFQLKSFIFANEASF